MKTLKLLFALLFISISITFAQTTWDFDKSHSKIGFSVTHLLITDVEGQFKDFEGTIVSTR